MTRVVFLASAVMRVQVCGDGEHEQWRCGRGCGRGCGRARLRPRASDAPPDGAVH